MIVIIKELPLKIEMSSIVLIICFDFRLWQMNRELTSYPLRDQNYLTW